MKRLEKLFGRRLRALPWGKPLACEILVDGDNISTLRRGETYKDLIAGEKEFLNTC
jgi:hypothetical protein